jgi:hypothetical protein
MEEEGQEDILVPERGQSQQLTRPSDEKFLSALVTTFGCYKPFLLDFETPFGGPIAHNNCPSLETFLQLQVKFSPSKFSKVSFRCKRCIVLLEDGTFLTILSAMVAFELQ